MGLIKNTFSQRIKYKYKYLCNDLFKYKILHYICISLSYFIFTHIYIIINLYNYIF